MSDARIMWAVGPDGEEGWKAIAARTEDEAVHAYCNENDCDPEWIVAVRVPTWDALEKVRPVDWFNSGCGLTYACSECDSQTSSELEGKIIDGLIYCEYCAALRAVEGRG